MKKELKETIEYFHYFSYAATTEELYVFLKKRVTFDRFRARLQKLCKEGWLKARTFRHDYRYVPFQFLPVSNSHYTLGGYSIKQQLQAQKIQISRFKLQKLSFFISVVGGLPTVCLVGLSGSVAMLNAKETDDVDLFIITRSKTMWITRFLILTVASLLKVRRKYGETEAHDKACFNLIFDERDLAMPNEKRTEYVAHEILQMKPLVSKAGTYLMFLDMNRWVFDIFPNAHILKLRHEEYERSQSLQSQSKWRMVAAGVICKACEMLNPLAKAVQMMSIQKRITKERVTETQLWFHPEDFGERMRGN